MSDGGYRSPTVRHKRLTAELRRLRSESGLTRDDVASRLEWHPTKVTRIETGQWTRLNPRDVRDLLDIYSVNDPEQREALVQLARESRQKGWWHSYGDVLPSEYSHFIGLEAEAGCSADLSAGARSWAAPDRGLRTRRHPSLPAA